MRQVTLALTHYNRFELLQQSFDQVLEDERIGEIVISDDCSTDGSYERILKEYALHPKVKVYRNEKNLDCYANKRQAVLLSTNEWVILFDSDNVIDRKYLDVIEHQAPWDLRTFYCPEFARPSFDYREVSGMRVDRHNIKAVLEKYARFECALNTANYFVNRAGYLTVWDGSVDPHTSDTIYQAYNWLRLVGSLYFVPGLSYYHRIHPGSHYKLNVHKTGDFAKEVLRKIRSLGG